MSNSLTESTLDAIREADLKSLSVCFVDFSGAARAKARPAKHAEDFLKYGVRFAKANFGLNSFDILLHSNYTVASGEVMVLPDQSTFTILPYATGVGKFIGDLMEIDGKKAWEICPRSAFKKVLGEAESMGFSYVGAAELEFHVLRREADGLIIPFETAGIQSEEGFERGHALIHDLIDNLGKMHVETVKANVEGGSDVGGHFELDILHSKGVKCADDVVMFRDAAKLIALKYGYTATFLAKVGDEYTGSGMHIHSSLSDKKTQQNLFAPSGEKDERGMGLSQKAYYFIGGLLEHARALCAVLASNVNSYRRLMYSGHWATDAVAYGLNHRGLAVRVPQIEGKKFETTNVEVRIADPALNPYLGFSCLLAAGLDGIKKKIDPGDPTDFDLSGMSSAEIKKKGLKVLPKSLSEALYEFENDKVMEFALGKPLFEEYLHVKRQEWELFSSHVTPWEIERLTRIL